LTEDDSDDEKEDFEEEKIDLNNLKKS